MDDHSDGDVALQAQAGAQMKFFTPRGKRIALIWLVKLKRLTIFLLPFAMVFWVGLEWGKAIEANRIHNDCKFTNAFRITDTGYACRIGRM
jgi:hypothetical protein